MLNIGELQTATQLQKKTQSAAAKRGHLQTKLESRIQSLWPSNSQSVTVKVISAAALHLLGEEGHTALVAAVGQALTRRFGCNIKALGVHTPLTQLLVEADGFFQLVPPTSANEGAKVRLDTAKLLGQPAAPQQQIQQTALQQSPTASAASACSFQQLLQHVQQKVWDPSNPQLDVVRRALAEQIVRNANTSTAQDMPADASESSYVMQGGIAGEVVMKTFHQEFKGQICSFRKMSDALSGSCYFHTYMANDSQTKVVLRIGLLLQEAVGSSAAASSAHVRLAQAASSSTAARSPEANEGEKVRLDTAKLLGQPAAQQQQIQQSPISGNSASAAPACSFQQLLRHVQQKIWDPSKRQLDVVRHALAEQIVRTANTSTAQDMPANTSESSYVMQGGIAGGVVMNTFKEKFNGQTCPFKKMKYALVGSHYFHTYMGDDSQSRVVLRVGLLLQEAVGSSAGTSSAHVPLAQAASSSTAARSPAGTTVQQVRQPAAAARRSASPAVSCTVQQLLAHVEQMTWDSGNRQLDEVRRALALHLSRMANAGNAADLPAVTDEQAYKVQGGPAGIVIGTAFKQKYPQETRSFTFKQAISGSPYLHSYTIDSTTYVVLKVGLLLQEAAGPGPAVLPAASAASSSITAVGRQTTSATNSTAASSSSAASLRATAAFQTAAVALMPSAQQESPPTRASNTSEPGQQHSRPATTQPLQSLQQQQQPPHPPPPVRPQLQPPPPPAPQQPPPPSPAARPQPPPPPPQRPSNSNSQQLAPSLQQAAVPQPLPALMPLPEPLLQLNQLSSIDCAIAEVHIISATQQLQDMLKHLKVAKLAAVDLEFAQAPQPPAAAGNSSKKLARGRELDELALVQLLVPAAAADRGVQWPATIYLVEVPEQQDAAEQLLRLMQPVLQDDQVIKVMHDARQDSCVLARQFDIRLEGVLDTQVLAGLATLATAAGGSCRSSESSWDGYLGRMGLGRLYEMYGFPHPTKADMGRSFDANPRLWFTRPLPADAVAYAADDVRYLLPLVHCLLQQLPAAVVRISMLQLLLAQQGAVAVRLQPKLVNGYAPLLTAASSSSSSSGGGAGSASNSAAAAGTLAAPGLTSVQFEVLLAQKPGWYLASYAVYLNEDHRPLSAPVAGEPEAVVQATLWDVTGSSADVRPCAAGNRESLGAVCSSNSDPEHDVGLDEAVQSIMQVLPASVQQHLQPFLSADHKPQLIEVIVDKNKQVVLRFSDRTYRELPCKVDIQQALLSLQAARQQWVQQGMGFAGADTASNTQGMQDGSQEVLQDDGRTGSCSNLLRNGSIASSLDWPTSDDSGPNVFGTLAASSTGSLRELMLSSRANSQVHLGAELAGDGPEQPGAVGIGRVVPSDSSKQSSFNRMFGSDQRMGIPGTLHRISAMRDKQGKIYGLTYRIGRHVPGVALLLADLLSSMKASIDPEAGLGRPQSLLLLGRPGVGKTTLLRDIARLMSLPPHQGGLGLMVIIVDTSNEIAGDAEECHPCIGNARRMMVAHREQQADVLVQAVQNHNPDVIIVDEIGTEKEVRAARTISQRGVLLIGTAHGNTLSNILSNPELKPLVGGVKEVTLGDAEAKATNRGQKTRLERAGAATFVTLLELQTKNRWRLHLDVERSVDTLLGTPGAVDQVNGSSNASKREQTDTQLRSRDDAGRMIVQFESPGAARQALTAAAVVAALANGDTESNTEAGGVESTSSRSFTGGWLVDLMHAAGHKSIEYGVAE